MKQNLHTNNTRIHNKYIYFFLYYSAYAHYTVTGSHSHTLQSLLLAQLLDASRRDQARPAAVLIRAHLRHVLLEVDALTFLAL